MQMLNPNRARKARTSRTQAVAGAGNYDPALRPTFTFNELRNIESLADVTFPRVIVTATGADAGLEARPFSIAGNVVTFMLMRPASAAGVQAAAPPAAHAHNLQSTGVAGAPANALGLPAGLNFLNDAGPAAVHTIPGGVAGGGVQNTTQTYGAGVAVTGAEVQNAEAVNLALLTVYGEAVGL